MKVCEHRGLVVAVLTRNEHCPPHVHVGTDDWDARFESGFWHDAVRLWDVVPVQNMPSAALLEELRQVVKQAANLRRSRELWWLSRKTLCIDNLQWDPATAEVVSPRQKRRGAVAILSSRFDAPGYKTVLTLVGDDQPLEIQL
jgi:hypothetical protein